MEYKYKAKKVRRGVYLYRGYTIQREDMSENDVLPKSTVRWEIIDYDWRGACVHGNESTLDRAKRVVDWMISERSKKAVKRLKVLGLRCCPGCGDPAGDCEDQLCVRNDYESDH